MDVKTVLQRKLITPLPENRLHEIFFDLQRMSAVFKVFGEFFQLFKDSLEIILWFSNVNNWLVGSRLFI